MYYVELSIQCTNDKNNTILWEIMNMSLWIERNKLDELTSKMVKKNSDDCDLKPPKFLKP